MRLSKKAQSSGIPDFSSPIFPSNHEFDIRTLVSLVPCSSLFLSSLLSPETFSTNNTNRSIALHSNDKPRSRAMLLVTQMSFTEEKSKMLSHVKTEWAYNMTKPKFTCRQCGNEYTLEEIWNSVSPYNNRIPCKKCGTPNTFYEMEKPKKKDSVHHPTVNMDK
jgi:hypothetical protein